MAKMKRYDIYPSYWAPSWGEPPLLGKVIGYNEFEAVRNAYNKGIVRYNFTFEPKPVEIVPRKRTKQDNPA